MNILYSSKIKFGFLLSLSFIICLQLNAADNICSAGALSSSSALAGGTNNTGNNSGFSAEASEVFGTEYNGEGNSAFNTCEGPGTFTTPGNPGPSDWWTFTPTITGQHCFAETTGFGSDHQMAIFEDTGAGVCPGPNFASLSILGSSDDAFAASVGDGATPYTSNTIGATSTVSDAAFCVNLTAGTTYYVQVSSVALFSNPCGFATCNDCFANFDPGGAYTLNVAEPPPCEIEITTLGGAGYAECQNIQDEFDAAGGFGGFPGFTAADDPCTFCSAVSTGIDFGTQPSQDCVDEINDGGFETWFDYGYDLPLDGCNLPATAVLGVDCPAGGAGGFSNVVYDGDGCTFDFITAIQIYNVPDNGFNCPCAGTCSQGEPVTQAYGACPQGNDPCSGIDLLQTSLTVVPGSCGTAGSVTVETTCPETGDVTVCNTIQIGTTTTPDCGDSGTDVVSFAIDDPILTAALTAAGIATDPFPCPSFTDVNIAYSCSCASCDGTYEGNMIDICSNTAPEFTFTACDVLPGGGGTGGVGLDYDLYIYAPGGNPVGGAPGAYIPNPVAGTFGQFPHPNTDLIYQSSTFDFGQTCPPALPAGALTNNTCDPYMVTFFLVPYDYTFDIDPDPLNGEFGFYPDNTQALCQPTRHDIMVYPDGLVVVETPGTCEGTPSMVAVNSASGTECATATAAAVPADPVCPSTSETDMFTYSFSATDLGLDMAPAACQPSFNGQIDVTCTGVCCEIMDPTTTPAEICQGNPAAALTAAPTDPTCDVINWYSDAAGTTQVSSGASFIPSDTAPGTYTYYAQCVDSTIPDCESALVAAVYTINAEPGVSLDTPALNCTSGPQALNPSPAGGVYSGSGATLVTNDEIDPADVSEGVTYEITYTYTSPEGCVGSSTISFSYNIDCGANGGSF